MSRLRNLVLALGCVALAVGAAATPAIAQVAERQAVPPGPHRTLRQAVAAAVAQAPPAPARKHSAKRAAVIGGVIGAGAGAALAVWYATTYGHNEGDGICGACLATWGM